MSILHRGIFTMIGSYIYTDANKGGAVTRQKQKKNEMEQTMKLMADPSLQKKKKTLAQRYAKQE